MKKILIAILLAVIAVFGVAGCNLGTGNLQAKIDELQETLGELNQTLSEMDDKVDELERELTEMAPGSIYTLKEAFDNRWLTKEDLMSIAYYHNNGRANNEEIMGEDYTPLPQTPLDEKTEYKVKCAMAKDYNENYKAKEKGDDYTIDQYCETYNGCVVVMAHNKYSGTTGEVWIDSIEGINIYYNSGRELNVWRDIK